MCVKVDSSNFILNYFYNTKELSVNLTTLLSKKKQIENIIGDDIYIILSNESIDVALLYYRNILKMKNNRIYCNIEKLVSSSIDEVNYNIPLQVRSEYLKLLSY
jgi:hypothetical protein